MVQKKIDSRIRTLIENGVKKNQRTMMILIGDNGKDQVFAVSISVKCIDPQSPLHVIKVPCSKSSFCFMVL